ncbi:MAG: glutamate ligase domain-containing protein, partial [Flavobacteriales bacterium]
YKIVIPFLNNLKIEKVLPLLTNLPESSKIKLFKEYIPLEKIKKGIESYIPTNNRSQLVTQGSNRIIMDAYNANPSSMVGAIENLVKSKADNKFFILGDMLELGEESEIEHRKIISLLQNQNLDGILVGNEFMKYNTTNYPVFKTNKEAKVYLKEHKRENTLFLIKGSRGIKLETIQEVL